MSIAQTDSKAAIEMYTFTIEHPNLSITHGDRPMQGVLLEDRLNEVVRGLISCAYERGLASVTIKLRAMTSER